MIGNWPTAARNKNWSNLALIKLWERLALCKRPSLGEFRTRTLWSVWWSLSHEESPCRSFSPLAKWETLPTKTRRHFFFNIYKHNPRFEPRKDPFFSGILNYLWLKKLLTGTLQVLQSFQIRCNETGIISKSEKTLTRISLCCLDSPGADPLPFKEFLGGLGASWKMTWVTVIERTPSKTTRTDIATLPGKETKAKNIWVPHSVHSS